MKRENLRASKKYEDSKKDVFKLVEIREKTVLIKAMKNHSYNEYSSFSEQLDPQCKKGHIELPLKYFLQKFSPQKKEKGKRRIWTEEELYFPWYSAKFGMGSAPLSMENVLDLIPNVTQNSFEMQTANFRYGMGIPGYELSDISKLQRTVIEKNNNLTYTQAKEKFNKITLQISRRS